jgi:hypothetical protein
MKLIESLTLIDTAIQADFPFNIRNFGLCYLQEKDGKTFPLQNVGNGQGQIVHWKDTDAIRTYHRVISSENETDSNSGFGKNMRRFTIYNMRLVGIGTRSILTSRNYEDTQEFCEEIKQLIPAFLAPGATSIVQDSEVNKLDVYNVEFSGNDHKSISLMGIAFWINYQIKLLNC